MSPARPHIIQLLYEFSLALFGCRTALRVTQALGFETLLQVSHQLPLLVVLCVEDADLLPLELKEALRIS